MKWFFRRVCCARKSALGLLPACSSHATYDLWHRMCALLICRFEFWHIELLIQNLTVSIPEGMDLTDMHLSWQYLHKSYSVYKCFWIIGHSVTVKFYQNLTYAATAKTHTPHLLICQALPQMPHANAFFAEVDVCHSNPCANGATCVESADSYKCLCLPSYGGDRCEIGRVGSASANNY